MQGPTCRPQGKQLEIFQRHMQAEKRQLLNKNHGNPQNFYNSSSRKRQELVGTVLV